MIPLGTKIDRYTILGVLGQGGMGEVYHARDERLLRDVALKILHVEGAADLGDDGAETLVREARAAAALEHPHIVAIYDVGRVALPGAASRTAFIAMELVRGKSLRAFVGDTTVTVARRMAWLREIASALDAVHALGLVHRDVKPDNVMIRDDDRVKVLDFGIAKRAHAHGMSTSVGHVLSTLTSNAPNAGTPRYMAPEQLMSEPMDGRTDQFAWGILAYELLGGAPAWDAELDPVRLVAAILSKTPPPLDDAALGLPRGTAAVVARATAKRSTARFPTMRDLSAALDAPPVRATTADPAPVPTTSVRSREPFVATADPHRERAFEPPKRRSMSRVALFVGVAVAVAAVTPALFVALRRSVSLATPGSTITASATPMPAPGPTKMTDVPLPTTSNAEALAAYRRGVQALHDADNAHGFFELDAALKLDSALGAASVRLCMFDGRERRAPCAMARQLRSTLSERDAAMLDASSPIFDTDAPNYAASAERCVALAARYPGDAEIALVTADKLVAAKRVSEASKMIDRALEIDPTFALAHMYEANCATDGDSAIRSLDACLAVVPTAGTCIRGLERYVAHKGDCAAYEALSRRNLLFEPNAYYALSRRLDALLASGTSRADLASVIDAMIENGPGDARARLAGKRWLEAAVAAQFGAFDDATVGVSNNELLLLVANETGDARSEIARARAVLADITLSAHSASAQSTALAFFTLRRTGELTAEAIHTRGAAWADERRRLAETSILGAWESSALDGAIALTPGELQAALDARPPEWEPGLYSSRATLGHAALAGGKIDDAIAILTVAARACRVLDLGGMEMNVFSRVHARYDLGEALATRGDTPGACASFAQVVAQWGNAKPRSVTADKARMRMKTLGCPR